MLDFPEAIILQITLAIIMFIVMVICCDRDVLNQIHLAFSVEDLSPLNIYSNDE